MVGLASFTVYEEDTDGLYSNTELVRAPNQE